ncbi:MAG: VOC family protein, partial [Sediminibacterium sp.]|nr:VOC family protein [Sediminibacterium sp.]
LFLWLIGTCLISCKNNKKNTAHFNHVAIYVVNLERSVEFYKNIFNFDKLKDPFNDDKHYWFKIGKKSMLHIILGADSTKQYYINQHTCYSVHNLEEVVTKLQKMNWEYCDKNQIKNKITTREDGVKQIYFKDPDGYWLEVNNDF